MGGPLAFQQYNHYHYERDLIKYSCHTKVFIHRTQFISKICPNLTSVKMSAKTDMHPLYLRRKTCTLMLLSNLAEPDWISISCKEKLLNFIVCTKKTITTNSFDIN